MAEMETHHKAATEMTPQERAEQVLDRVMGITHMQPYQRAERIRWLIEYAQQTRRAALLEVAELHQEWRNGKHSGTFSDLLRHKLAQEG